MTEFGVEALCDVCKEAFVRSSLDDWLDTTKAVICPGCDQLLGDGEEEAE